MADWKEHQLLVISTLDELKSDIRTILKKLDEQKSLIHEQDKQIFILKHKSQQQTAALSLVGGFISAIGVKISEVLLK